MDGGVFVVMPGMKRLLPLATFVALLIPGTASATTPSLGPNVIVLDPSMPQAQIQSTLDAISTQQVPNQFGTQRYAIFFEPGTYGSADDPLDFQVGYYTQVAGLGATPGDVVVNGAINVFNQCSGGVCNGLNNFWRSLSNLTLNVHLPSSPPDYAPYSGDPFTKFCLNTNDLWAVSQAAPMRRVIVNGSLILQDYCSPDAFVSGGFFADDEFNGGVVGSFGQQQWFTRNSNIDNWTNGVWNQVFLGSNGAPAESFGPGTNGYTTLPATPVSQEAPFLYRTLAGDLAVFLPAVQHNSVGPDYANGPAGGRSIPIDRFFIASPDTPVSTINAALSAGRNLILTPGVYSLDRTIRVTSPDSIVLGLGFATLVPQDGVVAMQTSSVPGIKISGLLFDAGPVSSPALLQLGGDRAGGTHDANDPTLLQDVFFRIGGATPGQAATSLVVNVDNAILDDIWAWRADHGAGVGWTANRADTGVVVNGDDVTAYGLFVEHYQANEVIWNGQNGRVVFFQNEMPYDPPSQAAWMASPTSNGFPAFLVAPGVTSFHGYGMGSYSFFNKGVPIFAAQAFQTPTTPGVRFHDIFTIFLDATNGSCGISSVINGVGGSSTAANHDVPVAVFDYP